MDADQQCGLSIDELVVQWMGKPGWDLVLIDNLSLLAPGAAQRLSLERHSGPLFLISNRSTDVLVEDLRYQSVSLLPSPHQFELEDESANDGRTISGAAPPIPSVPIADRLIFKAFCLNPVRFKTVAALTNAIETIKLKAGTSRQTLGGLPVLPMGPAGSKPTSSLPQVGGDPLDSTDRGDAIPGREFARPQEGQLDTWIDELDDFDSV
ncbi:MAG: hypothetical protein AAF664_06590 [Planctomycetota bacterium]